MALVSIIIPVYNVSAYIEQSFLSALAQTYPHIEYIVVDDRGNDDSMDKVLAIKDQYPNKDIKILRHTENKGLSAARNTGIATASGKYVFFMDSDDLITPDCIATHIEAIEKYQADFSDGGLSVIGGRNIFQEISKPLYTSKKQDMLKCYFSRTLHISAWNKLIRTAFLSKYKIDFTEGLIYEDVEWVLRIIQCAGSMIILPQKTYQYMIRCNSITTRLSLRHIESKLYLNRMLLEYMEQEPDSRLKDLCKKYLTEERFKYSTVIISADLDFKTKKLYYQKLNASTYRKTGKGVYRFFTLLPFLLFYTIFAFPRKLYSLIVHSCLFSKQIYQ